MGMHCVVHSSDFLKAVAVEASALGIVGDERRYLVDAYLDGFLDEPLDAVGVLGGCDSEVEVVAGAVVAVGALDDLYGAGRGVGGDNLAFGECAIAVGEVDSVALAHA